LCRLACSTSRRRKVLGKLGITSRRRLRSVSPDGRALRRRSSFSRPHRD
jgi:hypothetical protein